MSVLNFNSFLGSPPRSIDIFSIIPLSNLFKAGETIEFEVLRKGSLVKNKIDERWPTPKNQKIVITDRVPLRNMLSSYNSPNMDFFVNSINIDEKDGTFDASLDINFYEKLVPNQPKADKKGFYI